MARIRTIKPEFWLNESLSSISEGACLLAVALLNYADDEGYFNANPALVKAACFPIREPSVSIHGGLTELSNIGFIRLGKLGDREYGHIVNFLEHQRINRPTTSPISRLKIEWFTEDSLRTHGGLTEGSSQERKGKERKGEYISTPRFQKPDIEDVRSYMETIGLNGTNPEKFMDFHDSKGWVIGKAPMKDWKAACRTWKHNQPATSQSPKRGTPREVYDRLGTELGLDDSFEIPAPILEARND